MNEKQKARISLNVPKCNLLFLILGLCENEYLRGMYFKLKTSFWSINSYFPELVLNYIQFKAQAKCHVIIW